ncbi:MAG: hypothetical protein EBR28_01070 [Planctomycetia bacterium]|nr:hypothetical protein [Planctomycetia bacterium]
MVQIPDNVRPYLDAVLKHHFWLLLAVVPLVVLPMVFIVRGALAAKIDSARSRVENSLSSVKSVEGIQPHPNQAWASELDKTTLRVKRETLAEWQRLWAEQQPLRVWPAALGQDFVQRVTTLKPGTRLSPKFLERYQNGVRTLVRTLPVRMGAEDFMAEGVPGGPGRPPGMGEPGMNRGRAGVADKPAALVQWNPADQQRLFASFNWEKPPSTTQVLLAQEELWVYGLLVDCLARANQGSAGAFNAAVPVVEQIAVGYPAAEDAPGGTGGRRIAVPLAAGQTAGGGEFGPPPEQMMMEGGGPNTGAGRPAHPRFGGGGPVPGGGEGAPPDPNVAPDDALKNWIYVDLAGKPLMAAEIAASPDAQFVHLVPFVIRAIVDERRLDALLVDLAKSPTPIDVRQVRINPGGAGAMPAIGPSPEFGERGAAAPAGRRPHDVTVELRGTVGLATRPDPLVLGLEAAPAEAPPAEENAVEQKPGAAEPQPVANAGATQP